MYITVEGDAEPQALTAVRTVDHLPWETIDTESCATPDRADILSKAEVEEDSRSVRAWLNECAVFQIAMQCLMPAYPAA